MDIWGRKEDGENGANGASRWRLFHPATHTHHYGFTFVAHHLRNVMSNPEMWQSYQVPQTVFCIFPQPYFNESASSQGKLVHHVSRETTAQILHADFLHNH